MRTWHIGKKCEATEHQGKDGERVILSEYYDGNEDGWEENKVRMGLDKSGMLTFSDQQIDGGFIALYPEQVKHLRLLLRKPAASRGKGEGK